MTGSLPKWSPQVKQIALDMDYEIGEHKKFFFPSDLQKHLKLLGKDCIAH